MDYEEFLAYIKDNIGEYMNQYACRSDGSGGKGETGNAGDVEGGEYHAEIHQVIKNNGIALDGLIIRKDKEMISPNIYLNSFFENYQMGKPLAAIMEEIIYQYNLFKEEQNIRLADIWDFAAIKQDIVLRLVNYDRNRELLKTCPHKRYLDLAVTFRMVLDRDCMGIGSALVTTDVFDYWDVSLDHLYKLALENTMKEFPWRMDSLATVITECMKRQLPEEKLMEMREDFKLLENTENEVSMYVLSNEAGMNGATCILYDAVLRNFAKAQGCNVYILPSSIHEVLLVPENVETDAVTLEEMVSDANHSAVGLIDLLSDHVYYYDRERDMVEIYEGK
ncbi:MAG: hypothetical protein K2K56_10035 [Lachnospiraceae bacterium]|nr:hypothetical protein [Lachnospiraceae bacterium]